MSRFKITLKANHGNMTKGTTLYVDTALTSCDAGKIRDAIKAAGYNKIAQDTSWSGYWDIEKVG